MLEELRQQIWERPDDRDLLAVYADALATAGETRHAEFIQLSLLASPSPAQTGRIEALRKKHRGDWLGPARKFLWTWEEDRARPGFIRRAQTAMPRFTKGFQHLRWLGPRLHVNVTAGKNSRDVREFAALPLSTIYGLGFHEDGSTKQFVTDFLLETIAPSLTGLKQLKVLADHYGASRDGIATLLSHLRGLEHLHLMIAEEMLPSLEDAPFHDNLVTFELDLGRELTAAELKRLRKLFPRCALQPGPDWDDQA